MWNVQKKYNTAAKSVKIIDENMPKIGVSEVAPRKVENPPTIARDTGDCVVAWRITWTEELNQATVRGVTESDPTKHTCTQAHAKDTDYATCSFYVGKDYNLQPMKHRASDTTALNGGSMTK